MYKCKYCEKEFESKHSLCGHTTRCKENPKNKLVYNCKFCSREFTNLSGLHRHENTCKYNPDKVNSKYLPRKVVYNNIIRDDLFCSFCGKQCKNENSFRNHERMCPQNPDQSYREKFNTCGHIAWNKGLTKETDERVAKCGQTYSRNHKLGLHTEYKNASHRQEVKDKISSTCLKKSKEGTWHTSLAKNMHIDYNGVDLHGSWELKYAQYLDANKIKWIRNIDRFPYTYKDKLHYYTPDFYLVDTDEYIEIKGYRTGKDYAKWKQFPKDKTLIVLMCKDLKSLGIDL